MTIDAKIVLRREIFNTINIVPLASQYLQYRHCKAREKTNKMQQLDVYHQYFLNIFRASLCPSSGEQDVCYCTWCAAL